MDFVGPVAIACIGAVVGATAAFLYSARLEARRRKHDLRLLLRSERREATARLLRAIDRYQAAIEAYGNRHRLIEMGADHWGDPPLTRDLDLVVQEAEVLADDGSPLMLGISAAYAAAHLLPTDKPDVQSPEFAAALIRVREAQEQLIDAMRDELGVAHWNSPALRRKLGPDG